MTRAALSATVVFGCLLILNMAHAADAPPPDVVTLKDGSVIHGEVVEMGSGILQIKSAAAGDMIKIKWTEVAKLKTSQPIPIHLKEGTILVGTVEEGEPGMMRLKAEPMQGTMTVPMDSVTMMNPSSSLRCSTPEISQAASRKPPGTPTCGTPVSWANS